MRQHVIPWDEKVKFLDERMGFSNKLTRQRQIIRDRHRFKLVTGGWRASKSYTTVQQIYDWYLDDLALGEIKPNDEYWLAGDTYDMCKREFEIAVQAAVSAGIHKRSTKRHDPGVIEIWLGDDKHSTFKITTHSLVDPEKVASVAPRGIAVCEAGQVEMEAITNMEGRVAENRAPIMLSGTLELSQPWYKERYTKWQSAVIQADDDSISYNLPSYSNTIVFPGGRQDPEILRLERVLPKDTFKEKIEGIPVQPRGRVHPMVRVETHIKRVEFIPGFPITLAIDPGFSRITHSAYAVEACQKVNGQWRVFDEIYEQELLATDIIDLVQKKPWWNESPTYGVIDAAGKTHPGAMESNVEMWLDRTGISLQWTDGLGILDGIERLNQFLKPDPVTLEPAMVFSPRAKGVLSELGLMNYPFDPFDMRMYIWKMSRDGTPSRVPRDLYNHGCTALRYMIWQMEGPTQIDHKDIRRGLVVNV